MIHSFKVSTTLAAYRIVSILSGTGYKVAYPEGALNLPIGVTKDTVLDTTQSIPVAGPGEIAKVFFNDTVTAGKLVAGDTSGRGVPFTVAPNTTTSLTVSSAYVGALVGDTVALTGTIADVIIAPGICKGTF